MYEHLKELLNYRELLISITLREIKVRYKQSLLGAVWAIIQPLFMMVIFTIIFSKFAKIPSDGIPYPIFSYTALLPWTLFASSLNFAIPSLVNNANLVSKIYFPREIFPISSVLAAFFDFGIASLVFIGMLIFYQIHITWSFFIIIPILSMQILFSLGISFLASAINVRYRDIKHAIPFLTQVWMYLTPIAYPVSIVPEKYRAAYMLNPMAGIIDSYRKILIQGSLPNLQYLSISFIIIIFILFVSYVYFKKVEMTFADII